MITDFDAIVVGHTGVAPVVGRGAASVGDQFDGSRCLDAAPIRSFRLLSPTWTAAGSVNLVGLAENTVLTALDGAARAGRRWRPGRE